MHPAENSWYLIHYDDAVTIQWSHIHESIVENYFIMERWHSFYAYEGFSEIIGFVSAIKHLNLK